MTRVYDRPFRSEGQYGSPIPGATVSLWTARTGGTQITSGITDLDDQPITLPMTCDAWGYLPSFKDTLDRDLYAIGSASGVITGVERVRLEPVDMFLDGGTITGSLIITPFSGAPSYEDLPLGRAGAADPAIAIVGSPAGGEDEAGGSDYDSTGRINFYPHQRAEDGSYGEVIRFFPMEARAKSMLAWYRPADGYDGSGDPIGTDWQPAAWLGAHVMSNDDPTSAHNHISIETPDSDGALQTRFELPFGPQGTGVDQTLPGLDHINIKTNLADLTVRADGSTSYPGGRIGILRIAGANGNEKVLELGLGAETGAATLVRWRIVANSTTESGSNAGTDFAIRRHADNGTLLGTALFVQRSTGNIALGQASVDSARITAVWGTSGHHGFYAKPSTSPGAGSAFAANLTAITDRLLDNKVAADASSRFVIFGDGKVEWGNGTTRDTNLYRKGADQLGTDDALDMSATGAGTLKVGTSTVEPAASITHLIDVRSGDGAIGGAYFKMVPSGGASTAHALNTNQTGTSGTGSALNAASSNRQLSAVQVRGTEDDTGTIKVTHVNASGTATGDAGSAAVSVDLQSGTSGGTRAHGFFATATGIPTTGYLMLLRNGGVDLATVGPAGDLYVANRALGDYHPADHGMAAWAYDPINAVNTTVVTNGTIYLVKMRVPHPVTVTKIYWHVGVAGVTATAAQNHVGLYSSAGTLLASTGVDADITTTGPKTTTITGQALTAGDYWVGMVFNAGTAPGLARTTGLAGTGGLINVGLTAANYRFATGGTAQTTLAAVTPGSNAQSIPLWAGIGA